MKLHQKLFFFFVFLLPTQLAYHFWPDWSFVFGIKSDYLSPSFYFTDILVLLIVFLWILKTKNYLKKLISIVSNPWIIAFAIIVVLNIFFSISWQVSIYRWVKFLEFVTLGLYVKENWQDTKNRIHIPLISSLVYVLAIVVAQLISQRTIGGLLWFLGERSFTASTPGIALFDFFGQSLLRPYAVFPHPNSLAGYCLIGGLLIYLLSKELVIKNKWLIIVGILSALVIVALSVSQLTWIVLGVTVLAILLKKYILPNFKYLVLFCFFVSLLLPTISRQLIDNYIYPKTIDERLRLNISSGVLITNSPFVGVGNGNFVNLENNYTERKIIAKTGNLLIQPVHNIYLLLVSEWGMVGFVFVFLCLFRLVSKNNNDYVLLLLPILITGMGDHYWLTLQQNFLLFSIILGIVSATKNNKNSLSSFSARGKIANK